MQRTQILAIVGLTEFLHGFAASFLTAYTARRIFGREIRCPLWFPLLTGLLLGGGVIVKQTLVRGVGFTWIVALTYVLYIGALWLCFTDRRRDALVTLAFAALLVDSVDFAAGNLVFAVGRLSGLMQVTVFSELFCTLFSYALTVGFFLLLGRIAGNDKMEPLPMVYVIVVPILVNGIARLSPNTIQLRDRSEQLEINAQELLLQSLGLLFIALLAVFLVRSGQNRYIRRLNRLNESYLEAQAQHFEAVRRNDVDIRRLNHDMRNHFACLNQLCRTQRYEEMGAYLDKLTADVAEVQQNLIKTGSGIADAILNEKAAYASQFNITLHVEGDFSRLALPAVDLCTILANLADNAIEAAADARVKHKDVDASVRTTGNFAVLRVSNYTAEMVDTAAPLHTGKQDKTAHGFGIVNIRNTAARYGGELLLQCGEDGGEFRFTAEVILPMCSPAS